MRLAPLRWLAAMMSSTVDWTSPAAGVLRWARTHSESPGRTVTVVYVTGGAAWTVLESAGKVTARLSAPRATSGIKVGFCLRVPYMVGGVPLDIGPNARSSPIWYQGVVDAVKARSNVCLLRARICATMPAINAPPITASCGQHHMLLCLLGGILEG